MVAGGLPIPSDDSVMNTVLAGIEMAHFIIKRKEERIAAVLEPRYDNNAIWHFKGGYTPMLEEELILARPPHDDLKDALACAIEIAIPPRARKEKRTKQNNVIFHSRFGGCGV